MKLMLSFQKYIITKFNSNYINVKFINPYVRLNVEYIHKIKNFSKSYCTASEMKYLNVAEKNDAAKNIANILSNGSSRRREGLCVYNKIYDFESNVRGQNCKMVMTSVSGHLLQYEFLPSYKNWHSCSPDQLFDAPIRKGIANPETGEKIKRTIEREMRSCQGLIIWTDCDREGENIGVQVVEVCKAIRPNLKIFRAKFSEITRASIFRAINNLSVPDIRQNDAVNIRQELDLRTGAAFTRYQTLRLQKLFPRTTAEKLISYGSCQIPTLGFVAERYKEVEEFVSEPFWKLKVLHTIEELTVEFIWARNRLFNKELVEDYLLLCLSDPKAKVENKTVKPKSKWRPQPMDTVELEKLGSRKLKINAKETMNIAEKLYNKGFISYPRTETNSFSSNINLRAIVEQHTSHPEWGGFASRVLEWGPNPRNGKKTDEAHPPIHPTKFATGLSDNEGRVYELIVRHFLACVSKDATGSETVVYIDIAGEKFSANGLVIFERNYLDVYPYEKWNAKQIHHYEIGQVFEPTEISMQEGATTAPPLLTEADLIALMEKHGIGTDATHAEHIHTIKERGYIGEVERGLLVPGTIGMGLYEGYSAMDLELAKPKLRAEFESDLKKVCAGQKDPKIVLNEQIIKYKEAFRLITQRINAMDEKFAARVNENPNRNNRDRDGDNDSSNNNRRNRRDDDDNDDDDDDNNFRGGGRIANNTENNSDYTDQGLPQPLQEISGCPKCQIGRLVLKKKREGNTYMISCNNFPECKNVIWFPDAIKEAKLTGTECSKCISSSAKSKNIEFKFKNNSYLALLSSVTPTYITCIKCDSKFRDVFDINVDRIKNVGKIVTDSSSSKTLTNIEKNSKDNYQYDKSKNQKKVTEMKTQKRNFSSESFNKNNPNKNEVNNESIGWVFDDDMDLFADDNFDEVDKLMTSIESRAQSSSNSNKISSNNKNSASQLQSLKNKREIDAYFTNWGKSNTPTANQNDDNWGEDIWEVDQIPQNEFKPSKWVSIDKPNKYEISKDNWFSTFNESESYNHQQATKRFKQDKTNSSTATEVEVHCKTCDKIARKLTVKKEGPNIGREFYTCDSSCSFFQWADDPNTNKNNSSMSSSRFSKPSTTKIEIKCACHKAAIGLQVRKEGPNQGKSFWKCSANKCDFFKWAEDNENDFDYKDNIPVRSSSSWGTKQGSRNEENLGSKKRKCGLCRMEGHTKNKCPRKNEFEIC